MKSKLLKSFVIAALSFCLVFSCLSLTACAPDPEKVLIGFWIYENDEDAWYEFHADGTCRSDGVDTKISTTTWKYIRTIEGNGMTGYVYHLASNPEDEYIYNISMKKFLVSYTKTKYKTYEEWSKATGKTTE